MIVLLSKNMNRNILVQNIKNTVTWEAKSIFFIKMLGFFIRPNSAHSLSELYISKHSVTIPQMDTQFCKYLITTKVQTKTHQYMLQ